MSFAIVFPGQGSQSLGMMKPYGDAPILKATFDEASSVLGENLWAMAQDGPHAALNLTVNTQPLMLAAATAVWRLWRDEGGPLPQVMAGHSLGEFTALVAAEALTFSQAISLVRLRATSMQQAVPAGQGCMAAVLGMDEKELQILCEQISTDQEQVSIANFNSPGQLVVAGHTKAVEKMADLAKAQGAKKVVPLPVSAPFHCMLMKPAAKILEERLKTENIKRPIIPVVHNVDVDVHDEPQEIREALVAQVYQPVRWIETIEKMAAQGITQVIECGPARVLTSLTRRIGAALDNPSLSSLESLNSARMGISL